MTIMRKKMTVAVMPFHLRFRPIRIPILLRQRGLLGRRRLRLRLDRTGLLRRRPFRHSARKFGLDSNPPSFASHILLTCALICHAGR